MRTAYLRRRLNEKIPPAAKRQYGIIIAVSGSVVTVRTERGITQAISHTVHQVGTPVILEQIDDQWYVVGIWHMMLPSPEESIPLVPLHHQNHELFNPDGGNDVVWVAKQQITPLLVYPSDPPSLVVGIIGTAVYNGSSFTLIESASADLTASVPSSDFRYVVISLDLASLTFASTNGEIGSTELPALDGHLPLAAIFLAAGQTQITWDHIVDLRQIPAIQRSAGSYQDVGLKILLVAAAAGSEEAPASGIVTYPPTPSGLLAALEAVSEGCKIILPPIEFEFEPNQEITIPAEVELYGNGAAIKANVIVNGIASEVSASSFGGNGLLLNCRLIAEG